MNKVNFALLVGMVSVVSPAAFADFQPVVLQPGQSVYEQLMDGRMIQFSCASPIAAQPANQAFECTATVTMTLPGYIGSQPTQDIPIVGDSAVSKLDAIAKLRQNCVAATAPFNAGNSQEVCNNLSEGHEIACHAL